MGLNWPVFFVRDSFMGMVSSDGSLRAGVDVIRSQQRNPQNFFVDWESSFDFLANVPESMHAGMMLWSDHGTPKAWRFNHGYGCRHTYKWSTPSMILNLTSSGSMKKVIFITLKITFSLSTDRSNLLHTKPNKCAESIHIIPNAICGMLSRQEIIPDGMQSTKS